MGMVYLPTWMVDFYGFHVGKYTSPMDPMSKKSRLDPILWEWWEGALRPVCSMSSCCQERYAHCFQNVQEHSQWFLFYREKMDKLINPNSIGAYRGFQITCWWDETTIPGMSETQILTSQELQVGWVKLLGLVPSTDPEATHLSRWWTRVELPSTHKKNTLKIFFSDLLPGSLTVHKSENLPQDLPNSERIIFQHLPTTPIFRGFGS